MIDKNDRYNPWTADDEKEHFPCIMEWWAAEAFFKSIENSKKWSLKVAFTEWFENPKKIGSILNMTLFDQDNNKHFIYCSRDDSVRLKSAKDRFDVGSGDSFMKGAFPNYEMRFIDPKNEIQIDFKYQAESYPHWIAQEATDGWLPMGFGFYRYGFIPKNKISGTIRVKDKTFTLKGKGYFEHVWGDFDYDKPILYSPKLKKTIVTYAKLARWWLHNRTIKIPKSITFSTDNNPLGYDWAWALLDNGWSLFYGNIMFWIMDGPAVGSLILSKDGKTYTEFCDVTFHYKKIKYADECDFYYPTELEVIAKKGKEKLHLTFKMTSRSREYISPFPYAKYHWIALAICEAPGVVEGHHFNGEKKTKLSGISKIEPQRQISTIGHNSLKLDFLLPPKGVGISMDLKSHLFKKKIFISIRLAPSPKVKCHFKRIDSSKIHKNIGKYQKL